MFLFTDLIGKEDEKYEIGFYIVYLTMFMIAVNLYFILCQTVKTLKLIIIKYWR